MKRTFFFLILLMGFTGMSFTINYYQDRKPWPVPDKDKKMKNPIPANDESLKAGKELWMTHCRSCHGTKGMGDGSKAAQLKTDPGDFCKADVQNETDGTLFYRTSEGRDDMPSFKKKLPDADDRWNLVNFIRTMKK